MPPPVQTFTCISYQTTRLKAMSARPGRVRCVEAANFICTLREIPSVGVKLVKFSRPAFAGLSLARDDVAGLIQELDEELSGHFRLTNT